MSAGCSIVCLGLVVSLIGNMEDLRSLFYESLCSVTPAILHKLLNKKHL